MSNQISLYSLHYAEASNELARPISALLRPGNTTSFKEISQRWRAIGNTVSNLTGPRFEFLTSRSRDERVAARPAGRYIKTCSKLKKPSLKGYTIFYDETLVVAVMANRNWQYVFTFLLVKPGSLFWCLVIPRSSKKMLNHDKTAR